MNDSKLLLFTLGALASLYGDVADAITYPPGTSVAQAWASPPLISSARAVELLSERFLTPHAAGDEFEIDDEEFEAFKYLVANDRHDVEEPSGTPGVRRFGAELTPETMSASELQFSIDLSNSLSRNVGLTAVAPPGVCVREVPLFQVVKYKTDFGWDVDVWGIAAFGHNVQYGVNHSDVVYGVFPFGIEMSWWDGLKCVLGGTPGSAQELRTCGRAKEWKLEGPSTMKLLSSLEHVVPGVAQASLTYAGALVSGTADTFQTSSQTRSTYDPTWLLGPSNTPLPSATFTGDSCVGPYCPMGVATQYTYSFEKIIAWFPDIVLNAGYNNATAQRFEVFRYDGRGEGNPHSIGNFYVDRRFSRFHAPLTVCN
jgi:hypothetical protein